MAFWDGLVKGVQNFFGGGDNQKKKRDEEEQRRQRAASSATPKLNISNVQSNDQQGSNLLKVQQPKPMFGTLNNSGAQDPFKLKTPVVKTKQQELDELTKQNMDQARKETERGQNWFDKTVNTINGTNNQIATQNARNKAFSQYREKNGLNADPEVMKYIGNTRDLSNKTLAQIKKWGDNLNTTQKVVDKVAQDIQYVPVAGSVFNAGLAANEQIAKRTGADIFGNNSETVRGLRNKVDFDMTNEEFDALDESTKGKLRYIQNIGLALTPLDFTGIGGFAKSVGVSTVKKAVIQLVKDAAIDAATKAALKTSAKGALKSSIPAAVMGTGASAGIQGYLTGEVDPLEALKGGLMVGGTSMLTPNAPKVTPEQRNLVNAAKLGMADQSRINVEVPRTRAKSVPVVNNTPKRPLISDMTKNPGLQPRQATPIREFMGDTPGNNKVVPRELPQLAPARNNGQVEGIIPGRVEDTTLYTKAEVDAERAALDQALANGEINKTAHKAATAELDSLPLSDAPTASKQIKVREVRSIPVDDMSSMPDPVRKVDVRDAAPAKKAAAINDAGSRINPERQFVSGADGISEVDTILANPKKFTKQQVAAARNQRKLARQMAKTKEQTAEAIERVNRASEGERTVVDDSGNVVTEAQLMDRFSELSSIPQGERTVTQATQLDMIKKLIKRLRESPAPQTGEGFVPTGEFGKSVNGGSYQKVSRASEMQAAVNETANLSPAEVIRQASETANQNGGGYNRRDIRNIAALFETKRIQRGTPEWDAARQILKEDGTNWGQTGALRNYTMRRNASADELISRFESKIYRLADDPSKIDSKLFDEVDAAETNFVDARDAAMRAYNQFEANPTSANAKAYHAAQDAADKADAIAKQVEYTVAQKALKGNKDIQQVRELEKMAQQADMYQMDAVDASMLSGTGTFVRNFVNASVGNLEEGLLGRVSSRIAGKLTGQNVGGGGLIRGTKRGAMNVVDASKARYSAAGKNPLEHLKNWATTGNQLGDALIDGQTQRNTLDHYTQVLKDQGYKGRELRDRAGVMARQDPDNVSETYQAAARTAAGLGSGVTRNNKIETTVKNIISDAISGGNPNRATEGIAKLVTRMTLGFPTAIGRSVAEGAKRFTLGAPTFIKAMRTSDPQARAVLIKEGIKQAGSGGLVIPSLFYSLGASGAITGGYPDDQAERDRWQREGITENSIKIGDDYYQLPAYLGSWAIPALFYAGLGRNNGDFGAAAADMKTVIPSLLPTDSISNLTDVINGRTDFGKWMSQTGASAIRAATPGGALLNEIGKMMDPTQNDTSGGNVWENLVSKVINGVPGANLMLSDKTDADGNPLANPDPLALALGAASTSQEAGVAKTQELNDQTNSVLENMAGYGAFSDPNLKAVISDTKTLKIYNDIVNGKQVNPEDLKKVQEAMVKGVSEKGTDTAYLEREQYDSHLTALQIKRELMAADPTQKPSDLKAMDVAIKRGEIYRDNEIPYDVISAYQDTGVDEWRKMGDPESDEYDPDTYQMLWAIDELMTKEGVSYAKGKLDKQKYSAKKAGSGRGRGGAGSKIGTDFGTLKTPTGAPSVQAYEGIESRNVTVPVIQKVRPNIVHKIEVSG